jgi:hypothetical protein
MSEHTLKAEDLGAFSGGTSEWHRYSPMFRQLLLTDGALHVAEAGGAYWLMDAIGSHIFTNRKVFAPAVNPFQVWTLQVINGKAKLIAKDGGKHGAESRTLATQKIEWSDFPLPEIQLWAVWDGGMNAFVLMLPCEY